MNGSLLEQLVGWLAREDKIIFNAPHDGKLANLSLMLNLYIG
jgi:hypothetical protein